MGTSSAIVAQRLLPRRGDYGFDAPYVPAIFIGIGVVLLVIGLLMLLLWQIPVWGVICLLYCVYMLLSAASYIYTTRRGKFQVWSELLRGLKLKGDEEILDLGCGRGAVLLMAAKFLHEGKGHGVDIWRTADQSGNASSTTQKNAELEGVAERVTLHTADMRQLPFADNSFDLILSSVAIHNVPSRDGRDQALSEAVRVLKPGGRLLIVDIREIRHYAQHLRSLGMDVANPRMLDWRFCYGAPWVAGALVQATKPSAA